MEKTSSYVSELKRAMDMLSEKGYIFQGQNCVAGGASIYHTIKHLPVQQRLELPVFENTQMGIAIGMSLLGYKICTIYPRMDFTLLCFDALINHLDKFEEMSSGQFKPKVIIRTAIGSVKPLMPGPQHCKSYYNELKSACTNIDVILLDSIDKVFNEYEKATNSNKSTILIEIPDLYNSELEESLKKSREKGVVR